jgi:hypothetical protein
MAVIIQRHGGETVEPDQNYTRSDLVDALRRLRFDHRDRDTLRIDRQIRTFLINALRRKGDDAPY